MAWVGSAFLPEKAAASVTEACPRSTPARRETALEMKTHSTGVPARQVVSETWSGRRRGGEGAAVHRQDSSVAVGRFI